MKRLRTVMTRHRSKRSGGHAKAVSVSCGTTVTPKTASRLVCLMHLPALSPAELSRHHFSLLRVARRTERNTTSIFACLSRTNLPRQTPLPRLLPATLLSFLQLPPDPDIFHRGTTSNRSLRGVFFTKLIVPCRVTLTLVMSSSPPSS